MADKDFVVKNGLVVNGSFTANSTLVNASAITATNINATSNVIVGNTTVNAVINSTAFTVANSTVTYSYTLPTSAQKSATNYFLNANGSWEVVNAAGGSGGAYYKGNQGNVGQTADRGNLYRINGNTQTANVTIDTGENSVVAGPITISSGVNLTINTGGRVVVI